MTQAFLVLLLLGVALAFAGIAMGGKQAPDKREVNKEAMDFMSRDYQKSMNRNKPMPTGMARPGMKQGNVESEAKKKEAEMKKMMDQEMK
jgi:hypothetical protein